MQWLLYLGGYVYLEIYLNSRKFTSLNFQAFLTQIYYYLLLKPHLTSIDPHATPSLTTTEKQCREGRS